MWLEYRRQVSGVTLIEIIRLQCVTTRSAVVERWNTKGEKSNLLKGASLIATDFSNDCLELLITGAEGVHSIWREKISLQITWQICFGRHSCPDALNLP